MVEPGTPPPAHPPSLTLTPSSSSTASTHTSNTPATPATTVTTPTSSNRSSTADRRAVSKSLPSASPVTPTPNKRGASTTRGDARDGRVIDLTSTPSRASSPAEMAGAGGGRLQERMRQAAAKGPTPAAAARPVPRPTTPAATHTAQPAGTTSGSQDAVAIVTKLEETIPDLSSNGFPCFVDLVKEEEFVPSLADPAISPSSRARSKTPSERAPSTSRGTPGPSNVRRNQTPRPNLTARTPTPAPPIILQAARRLHRDTTPYRRPSHRFASVPTAAAHPGWQGLGSGAVCGVGGRSQRARDDDVEMVRETRERSLVPAERVTAVSGAVRAPSATRAGVNAVQDISESSDEDEDEVTILGSQRAPITAAERRAARTSRRADEQMPPPPPPTEAGPSLQQHRVEHIDVTISLSNLRHRITGEIAWSREYELTSISTPTPNMKDKMFYEIDKVIRRYFRPAPRQPGY